MKTIITSANAPAALGPYSHATKVDNFIFTSGQLGLDPNTDKLPEGAAAQAAQAIDNLEQVLLSAGAKLSDVVKTTVFVTDLKEFGNVNSVYAEKFKSEFPARSCVQVAALPAGALVEIEAVAFIG